MKQHKSRIALVGRQLKDNENLGLGYLEAALDSHELSNRRFILNSLSELGRVARELLAYGPSVVGLSLADGGSAAPLIALASLLRMRGYSGHITCGGPFASLARQWLLERYEAIDSIVRFAGEPVLPALAIALERGLELQTVAGLTTRAGDGLSAPILDGASTRLIPHRAEMPSIFGYGAAHILATRGCEGRCTYCGPAALQVQEWDEGKRAGIDARKLRTVGVGASRRRPLEGLCDEISELWHEKHVRYFYFVDEHFLPSEEQDALSYLAELRSGLRSRGVRDFAFGAMLRADRLTSKIVTALCDSGMVRVFLGVEFGTVEQACGFGRKTRPEAAFEQLIEFESRGVAVVSNLMLVHPDSTVESLQETIAFLSRVPAGVFEATRMMVYHGTRLWERMGREGRLSGNPFRYGYQFNDPVVERLLAFLCI